jgi:taurine transport system substrate-binding protein
MKAAPSSGQATITVQQGWQPDLAAPLFYAEDNGLFKKAGVNVAFTRFNSGPAFFAALRSGSIDLADFTTSALAAALASKVPVRVFYVIADTGSTNVLVVQPNENIKSAADLKGKTVASVNGSLPYYGLTKYLAASHMTLNDVKYLNLPPTSIIAAFKKHEVDAAYLWAPYFEELVAAGGIPVTTTKKDGVGALDIWVANASWYDRNPDAVKRLIQAMSEAQQAVSKDPQAGIASLVKWGFDPNAAATGFKDTIYPSLQQQLDPKSPYALVPNNNSVVQKYTRETADFFAQSGFVQPVSEWNGIFDAKPMQEVASRR